MEEFIKYIFNDAIDDEHNFMYLSFQFEQHDTKPTNENLEHSPTERRELSFSSPRGEIFLVPTNWSTEKISTN